MKQKKILEIIEEFNREFDSKIQIRREETPILMGLFQQFSDQLYRDNKLVLKGIEKKQKIVDSMSLTDKQLKLMEKYDELEYLVSDNMVERAFIYGYAVAQNIKFEAMLNFLKFNKKESK